MSLYHADSPSTFDLSKNIEKMPRCDNVLLCRKAYGIRKFRVDTIRRSPRSRCLKFTKHESVGSWNVIVVVIDFFASCRAAHFKQTRVFTECIRDSEQFV